LLAGSALVALLGCGGPKANSRESAASAQVAFAHQTSLFGPAQDYRGSELPELGRSGLFAVRGPAECEVAIFDGSEDSLAVRLDLLKRARRSIRVQALIFTADESGLRVAELLKQRKRDGLDVRVIVDAVSNGSLPTQWMYFDLKQHGIEVEGYEAIALQWLNELPVLMPHPSGLTQPNQRFHEKLWIVDGEAPDALAVTGGLNIANEYFRVNPGNPDRYWRDQDVLVRGAVVGDLVKAFDRNFEYFVSIKRSRGVFDTDLYWEAMRKVVASTGKVPITASTTAQLVQNVAALEARTPSRRFSPATCRFLQSRPRLRESYIQQAYLKLLAGAEREVLIANAYFVPTSSLRAAIKDAVQRCVAVTILCNGPETNDTPGISLLGRGYYRELLAVNDTAEVKACAQPAGLQIWEWRGQRADEPTRSQGLLHAKFAVADRRVSIVGSYNLDPRSERLNSESALAFESAALAEQLAQAFLSRDLASSRRIGSVEAAAFERPSSVLGRFKQRLGRVFEEHL
jgi:cardiolipin synthase C